MKPEIFAVELKQDIDASTFDFLLIFVQTDKQERINNIKSKNKKDLTLVGDTLAKIAISRVFGLPFSSIRFEYKKSGKPFVTGYPNVHFNISHSGNVVVCSVHNQPVGIDVQKMKDVRFDALAKRVFTTKEQECFFSVSPDKRKQAFYEIWTAKESYIKWLGTGTKDLKKDIDDACVVDTNIIFHDYAISLCSNTTAPLIKR
jgi:4'-phosphopantetheinyl transferase